MPSCLASSSLIWNRISQVSVCCVCWTGVSGTGLGWILRYLLRLVTSLSRVATVIRWSPTIAAAPILTGPHPVTTSPAPSTRADTLMSLRSTAMSFLTSPLSRRHGRQVGQHRTDDLTAPGQQLSIPQRLPADASGLRHRYEHGTHGRLQQRLRVQALHPDLPRVGQLDRREPDVVTRRGDV